MANPSIEVGYRFEKTLKKVFEQIKKRYLFDFHRYNDTKSAGGRFQSPQPADYEISFIDNDGYRRHFIVEAKASEETSSLRRCVKEVVRSQQIGKHIARLRSGDKGLFLFLCEAEGQVEVWHSEKVIRGFNGDGMSSSGMAGTLRASTLEQDFVTLFNIKAG